MRARLVWVGHRAGIGTSEASDNLAARSSHPSVIAFGTCGSRRRRGHGIHGLDVASRRRVLRNACLHFTRGLASAILLIHAVALHGSGSSLAHHQHWGAHAEDPISRFTSDTITWKMVSMTMSQTSKKAHAMLKAAAGEPTQVAKQGV